MSLAPLHVARTEPSPADYYGDEDVRARVREYCGGTLLRPPTAAFVAGFDPPERDEPFPTWDSAVRLPPADLSLLFERGCDISRSLWDTERCHSWIRPRMMILSANVSTELSTA